MKAKILRMGIMMLALNAVSGVLQAAPPPSLSNNPNPSGPNQGFVNGGNAGQSTAPVNDSNTVPAYDMPPAYPDNPAGNQSDMMGTPPMPPSDGSSMTPPPPPSDMPYSGTSGSGSTMGPNGTMAPPPPPPPGMHRMGPGPAGMPPPANGSNSNTMPQDSNSPAGSNMLPPAQNNGTTPSPSSKNRTGKSKPTASNTAKQKSVTN